MEGDDHSQYLKLLHACQRQFVDGPGDGQQLGDGGQAHPRNAVLVVDVDVHGVTNALRKVLVTPSRKQTRKKITIKKYVDKNTTRLCPGRKWS